MTVGEFEKLIIEDLGYEPTEQQRALIGALARFCSAAAPETSVFLLNGYAGTGKTSVVAALVKALARVKRRTVLLAPTGRAAKVMGQMAGRRALTIHRKIYKADLSDSSTGFRSLAENPHSDTIFIVDEASMIGGGENSPLLEDLVQYVYGNSHGCRMILLGDTAQLPPVGCEFSPAMEPSILQGMGLRVSRAVMTATVRQHRKSGILYNATALRRGMAEEALKPPKLEVERFHDVKAIGGEELEEDLMASYSRFGIDETILITRSNKRALDFNLAIRRQILEKEDVLTVGEPLMISKNNYFWTSLYNQKIKADQKKIDLDPQTSPRADFIANGEIAFIEAIYGTENIGYTRFADVALRLPDKDITLDAKIMITSLTAEGSIIEYDNFLANRVLRNLDPVARTDSSIVANALKADPYVNALKVKYAYAVTCHKAQGGQWESVFVDMGMISNEAVTSLDFYRWLYTSTTRAKSQLTYISPTIEVD